MKEEQCCLRLRYWWSLAVKASVNDQSDHKGHSLLLTVNPQLIRIHFIIYQIASSPVCIYLLTCCVLCWIFMLLWLQPACLLVSVAVVFLFIYFILFCIFIRSQRKGGKSKSLKWEGSPQQLKINRMIKWTGSYRDPNHFLYQAVTMFILL